MSKYMDHLEESTNVVKSRNRSSKLILTISYILVWSIDIMVFWLFTSDVAAMGYSIIYFFIIIPMTIFIISLLISRSNYWGKGKWLASIIFGIMYMLAEYATFSAANMTAFNKINPPNFAMIPMGIIISLIGLGIGHLLYYCKSR